MALVAKVIALSASWPMICTYIETVYELAETKPIYSYLYIPQDLADEAKELIYHARMEDYVTLKVGSQEQVSDIVVEVVLGTAPADTAEGLRTWLRHL